ncbi:MAG: FecR domain-containing protein [Armatimonadetes bacterium]|nr:FecR domain-containing protein [Armatimonadota bacterium]MCX7967329.1 FecR domain-containing protein [Armatimonadota bacterium]MDW8142519.1 FecR domain-containing protein [Armatimonadota bacterium]
MRLGSLALLLGLVALTLLIFGSIETLRIAPLIAKVVEVKGDVVAVLPPKAGRKQTLERPLKVGSLVLAGTTVKTGKDSFVVLNWVDDVEMRIGPETQLKVTRSSFNKATKAIDALFRLNLGAVFVNLKRKLNPRSRLELETPAITAAVRGTAYEVEVKPNGETILQVKRGTVAVKTAKGQELQLTAGGAIVARPDGDVSFVK